MYYSWLQIMPELRRHFCPVTTTTTQVTRHKVRGTKKVTGMHEQPHLIIMFVNSCYVLQISILKYKKALRLILIRQAPVCTHEIPADQEIPVRKIIQSNRVMGKKPSQRFYLFVYFNQPQLQFNVVKNDSLYLVGSSSVLWNSSYV